MAKPPHIKIQGCSGHLLASKPLEIVEMDFTLVERDSKGFENVSVITEVFTKYTVDTYER